MTTTSRRAALAAAVGAVPFTSGEAAPRIAIPPGACDCHVHVYDARWPQAAGAVLTPPDASVGDYRRLQQRIGTGRVVFVTPSTYGADNRGMLEALTGFGTAARGVAVIAGDETDRELLRLDAAGVRGVRLNLSLGTLHGTRDVLPIARRIAGLGWHLQLLMPPAELAGCAGTLRDLPVPIVFDHFARIDPSHASSDPARALVVELLRAGRAWLKLSGGYLVSATGSVEDERLDGLARSYLDAAPDRIVWGSDWPHATASAGRQPMPDDARQIERLGEWTGTAAQLARVLVDNPARLYGFDAIPH